MEFPSSIAVLLGEAGFSRDGVGKSGAEVLVFDDYVLKVRPEGSYDTRDAAVLRWLEGRLPAPRVAAHAVENGLDWLLMTRVRGRMLCDPEIMNKPALLMDLMAEALHLLWRVPLTDCPFRRTLTQELDAAERCIREGRFSAADCEPETFGPGGFESPAALLDWLRAHQPPVEEALTHGDFCLPNILTENGHISGMIDVGDCGAADRWRDLALGWRSLKHNSDGHYGTYPAVDPDDLFRALGIPKDEEKLRYYLLLDELF